MPPAAGIITAASEGKDVVALLGEIRAVLGRLADSIDRVVGAVHGATDPARRAATAAEDLQDEIRREGRD